jgi:hypothetical protein
LVKSKKVIFALAAFALIAMASVRAVSVYPGSTAAFLAFSASYFALVLLAIPRPRLYVYTFFAALLFLGFWAKFIVHAIFHYEFIEPIGNFDGSGVNWDQALLTATMAALGAIIPRMLHLLAKGKSLWIQDKGPNDIPVWFSRCRKPIWLFSFLAIISLNAWNLNASFYQIGINPRVVLPSHLNVIVAWAITIGFSIWLAAIIHWEVHRSKNNLPKALFAPIAEGLIGSISTLSRSAYLFHTVPYILVLIEKWRDSRSQVTKPLGIVLSGAFILGCILSLTIVSSLRVHHKYLGHDTASIAAYLAEKREVDSVSESDVQAFLAKVMARQVAGLVVDRWVGLEGVLAVSAYPQLGNKLLRQAIFEDPAAGNRSMYQEIAKSTYRESAEFTFLTLPGVAAVLYYSGSILIVMLGMAFVTSLMICTEVCVSWWIGNHYLLSVVGLGMAGVITQLNFPYLALVYFAELWVALLAVFLLQRTPAALLFKKIKSDPHVPH